MSELGFRMFNEAFSVGAGLIYAVFLTAFFHPFLTAQGGKRRKLLIIFSVCILCDWSAIRRRSPKAPLG